MMADQSQSHKVPLSIKKVVGKVGQTLVTKGNTWKRKPRKRKKQVRIHGVP